MKKGITKVFSIIMLMMVTVCFTSWGKPFYVYAENIDTQLALNDQWVSGSISKNGSPDYYTVSTPSAGWLTITVQSFVNYTDCTIYNADQTKSYSRLAVTGSTTDPGTKFATLAFEKGTYKIKIAKDCKYRIKGSFIAAGNNEAEPNNVFTQAMSLPENQTVTGFISQEDRTDFYAISIPTKRKIKITAKSEIHGYNYIKLYDSDYKELFWKLLYKGSEASPEIMEQEIELEPGLYYLKAQDDDKEDFLGRYTVKWETAPTPVSSIQIVGKKSVEEGAEIKLSARIKPDTATNKTVTWSSSKKKVAKVDNNGLVTGVKAGKVTITVSATDDSKVVATYEITVKKPNVKQVSTLKATAKKGKKVALTWKKQKNAKKYQIQIAKDKKFKKYLVDISTTKNQNKIKASYKLKGTAYVRVRAISKNGGKGKWSKTISVKIK